MLIKVFGHWINPEYIHSVYAMENINGYPYTTVLNFAKWTVQIEGKTPDEVAMEIANVMQDKGFLGCVAEINKQLKGEK